MKKRLHVELQLQGATDVLNTYAGAYMLGMTGQAVWETGKGGVAYYSAGPGLSNQEVKALNLRWRAKLENKGVEIPPLSPEGERILAAVGLGQSVGGISSGFTNWNGTIVVGTGKEGMPAWGETTTRIHELRHQISILSGHLTSATSWPQRAGEEALAMESELRFTRMLGINLPQRYVESRMEQIEDRATGGYLMNRMHAENPWEFGW